MLGSGVNPNDQCLSDEMFQSIAIFREGTTKLVCPNVVATVKHTVRN